jgi:hypothetical protein
MLRLARALLLVCLGVLAGCGGGGESNLSSGRGGSFSLAFAAPAIEVTGVEGSPETIRVEAALSLTGEAAEGVLIFAGGADAVLLDIEGYAAPDMLHLTLTLRGDLEPGDHAAVLTFHACYDEDCTRGPQGSPVRVPIHYRVLPKIAVQRELALSRQGRDAAPSAILPVVVPPEAGTVEMQATHDWVGALSVLFDGSALRITTQQVPAGVYTRTVTLRSTVDARYTRSVDITYTVLAPPGGEQPSSVVEAPPPLYYQQGATDVRRIVVARPTWTDAWDEPRVFNNDQGLITLTSTPDGQYQVAINTAGVPLGNYFPSIVFSAGPTGGMPIGVTVNITVNDSFHVEGETQRMLTATSTAADLEWAHDVLTFDGVPARWTAVSQSPLLQVVTGSGMTGSDRLRLRLDPAAISLPDWTHTLPVTLSIDRAGTLPQTVQFSVRNMIPTLHAALPSTLVGSGGRVYLEGNFRHFFADPLASNRLRVEGAVLGGGRLLADPRYLSDLVVLELDLTGATAGVPVRIHVDSALLPSHVELSVQSPLRAATSYQALPFGMHRPGQYSPGLGAFYFSKPGTAYRWQPGTASLVQASVAGLIDIAPSPDERRIYAATSSHLLTLHPQTLAQESASRVTDWLGTEQTFSNAAEHTRGLSFSADGRALASLLVGAAEPSYNIGTVCTLPISRASTMLIDAPRLCDPGTAMGGAPGPTPSGTVRSVNGSTVVSVNPTGWRASYRADQRHWVSNTLLPNGVTIAAVSDSGGHLVRSDGMFITADGTVLGNLGGVVPFTHRAGGYGLSSGGRFGLVYGYRTTGAGASERAGDAALWVVDLNDAAWAGVGGAPVVATLTLPSAVGCTAAFVEGEACRHMASISVAPGDGTAFVVGPRGVAAVTLPLSVTSAQPLSARAQLRSLGHGPAGAPGSSTRSRGRIAVPVR